MNMHESDKSNCGRDFLESSIRTFVSQKQLAERAVVQVPDEMLRIALHPETNSIAVIMKHVAGNLRSRWTDFLTSDGEKPWRDRDTEFVDTFTDRQELMEYWELGWDVTLATLGALADDDLVRTVEIRGEPHSVPLAIERSLAHTSYHVGQIVLLARVHAGDNWTVLSIPRGGSEQFNRENWGRR